MPPPAGGLVDAAIRELACAAAQQAGDAHRGKNEAHYQAGPVLTGGGPDPKEGEYWCSEHQHPGRNAIDARMLWVALNEVQWLS
jgi:hypothetical protein